MNARTLSPELERTAAVARVLRAKSEWTKSAVAFLHGHSDAQVQVQSALAELTAARAALADLDVPDRALDEG